MKHKFIFAALVLLALAPATEVRAYDFSAVSPSGHTLYYRILDSTAHTVYACQPNDTARYYVNFWLGYTAPTGAVTVPQTVSNGGETYTVTALYGTFAGCTGLTGVAIPGTVTYIGRGAFYGCSALSTISLPDPLKGIGQSSFNRCTALTSITVPGNVNFIGQYAFWGCTALSTIGFPSSLRTIDKYAFYNCTSLAAIDLPDSCTTIGRQAFAFCGSLSRVHLPERLTKIDSALFLDCTSLKAITIPPLVDTIEAMAFNHYGITQVYPSSYRADFITTLDTLNFNATNCRFIDCNSSWTVYDEYREYSATLATSPFAGLKVLNVGSNVKQLPSSGLVYPYSQIYNSGGMPA